MKPYLKNCTWPEDQQRHIAEARGFFSFLDLL